MIEHVSADLERVLRAHRPDDAERIVRELEVWRSLSGRWVALVPGRPKSARVNGEPVTDAPLSDCDVIKGEHLPSLLFLDRVRS